MSLIEKILAADDDTLSAIGVAVGDGITDAITRVGDSMTRRFAIETALKHLLHFDDHKTIERHADFIFHYVKGDQAAD